jgi:hypothetical protein
MENPTPKKKKSKRQLQRELIAAGTVTQFKKGVSGLLLKKGVKKATEDFLKLSLDYRVPDEWLVNGLEQLRGRKMTFGQVLTFRLLHSATTGQRNPALNDLKYIIDRVLGKMPTIVKHGEAPPEDDFENLTSEQLIELGLSIAESIQAKRTKLLPAAKTDAEDETTEADDQQE